MPTWGSSDLPRFPWGLTPELARPVGWVVGATSTCVALDTDTSTLDELMARLADGERDAFRPVFERLWPSMLRLCQSLLRSEADAADAAQEAMAKVLTRASDYDPRRAALPWALAIASWECRTLLRKRQRRREIPEPPALVLAQDVTGEDDAIQRQLVAAAIDVLGTLSEADRATLLATFWEEEPAVGGATLRKRRERALTRLRTTFRRLYGLD